MIEFGKIYTTAFANTKKCQPDLDDDEAIRSMCCVSIEGCCWPTYITVFKANTKQVWVRAEDWGGDYIFLSPYGVEYDIYLYSKYLVPVEYKGVEIDEEYGHTRLEAKARIDMVYCNEGGGNDKEETTTDQAPK